MNDHFDRDYWGDEINISRWKQGCARGIQYKTTGAPVAAGTRGVVRKISTGRKARGMSSDHVPSHWEAMNR